jgi:two-component system LytT family sensor kinase
MKKRVLLLLALSISCGVKPAFPQNPHKKPFGRNIHFNFTLSSKKTKAQGIIGYNVPDSEVYRAFDYAKSSMYSWSFDVAPNTPIMLGVKLGLDITGYNSAQVIPYSKSYSNYRITDSSDAIVIALGITKDNVNDYRYRVVENDSVELVHWSVPQLQQYYGAKQPYGFIGKFNDSGKRLLVEIMNVKKKSIEDGVVFDWRVNFKPVVTNIAVYTQADPGSNLFSLFRNFFDHEPAKETTGCSHCTPDNFFDPRLYRAIKPNSKVSVYNNNTIALFLGEHARIPYEAYLVSTDGKNSNYYVGNSLRDNECYIDMSGYRPGKYQIVIGEESILGYNDTAHVLRIPVTLLPPPPTEIKALLIQTLSYLAMALLGVALLFWFYRRRHNRKLARYAQARQTLNLRLRSIRAQLNPHFMFNALTSIQNLMNKKDTEGANHYLSRFAALTRKVLNTTDQELISLEDEIKILDDYLQMEQLRFNFKYQLKVDESINAANTEVPAMLLQPFVENAVKHGVANIREKGIIQVLIGQNGKSLVLSIIDNGPGFQQNNNGEGAFGLKLSEERIKLLNEVYTGQPAKLDIDTNASGTAVTITLINWIS